VDAYLRPWGTPRIVEPAPLARTPRRHTSPCPSTQQHPWVASIVAGCATRQTARARVWPTPLNAAASKHCPSAPTRPTNQLRFRHKAKQQLLARAVGREACCSLGRQHSSAWQVGQLAVAEERSCKPSLACFDSSIPCRAQTEASARVLRQRVSGMSPFSSEQDLAGLTDFLPRRGHGAEHPCPRGTHT
jgi:hypothetical protein